MASGRRVDRFFALVLLVMAAHEAEHVAQLVQKRALGNSCPYDCRGLLGALFDVEPVHVAYNHSLLLALVAVYAGYRMWERRWRERDLRAWAFLTVGTFVLQGYHVVEHSVKLEQWLGNGHRSPTPGILGRWIPLVELHFAINTAVFACVAIAFLRLRPVPLRAPAAAAAGLLLVPLPVAWATRTPVTTLSAGVHRGPLVLDRRQTLRGAPGAVVRGGIRITADGVRVSGVTVVGGEHGIEVDDATGVVLSNVRVVAPRSDGIHARRSSVAVRGCDVRLPPASGTQGIDLSFAMGEPPSVVEGCTISGGAEGIATHLVHADVTRNLVRATRMRAIAITEMSMGRVAENTVEDALGVGIYCGDYSECEIERNTVLRTRADPAGSASRAGYAIQAYYWASARLAGNRLVGNGRDAGAMVNAELHVAS